MTAASTLARAQTRVFLSHAGADTDAAAVFADVLRRAGVEVWFDKDSLPPGARWMEVLEQEIENSSAMVVYIGQVGVQHWVDREVRFALELNTRAPSAFKVIPVFGVGADPSILPPFLRQHQGIHVQAPDAISRLLEVLGDDAEQPVVPSAYWSNHSPFRSLTSFRTDDAWLFFGRDQEIADLVERLQRSRVLFVIGNSGSGKSSLIRAGLIPALRRGRFGANGSSDEPWRIAVIRPGADPFGELVDGLPGQLAPGILPADRYRLITEWRQNFS
jgi:hypothetical protein